MHANPFATFADQWLALWDPRELRKRWLAEMTHAFDRYMRSSAFLELMRFNLLAMTRSASLVNGQLPHLSTLSRLPTFLSMPFLRR